MINKVLFQKKNGKPTKLILKNSTNSRLMISKKFFKKIMQVQVEQRNSLLIEVPYLKLLEFNLIALLVEDKTFVFIYLMESITVLVIWMILTGQTAKLGLNLMK